MVALGPQIDVVEPSDPFEGDVVSPLPRIAASHPSETDPVAAAERRVTATERGPALLEERIAARLAVADAWMTVGAISPALEVTRQASTLAPGDGRVLERLGQLYARCGNHREAAEAFIALARASSQTGAWFAAIRAYARAEAIEPLERTVKELLARWPDDLQVMRFAIEATRAVAGNVSLVPRLLAGAQTALRGGEPALALRLAMDAWVESRGEAAGEVVAETLLTRGEAERALVFAVDAAERRVATGARSTAAPLLAIAARAARIRKSVAEEVAVLTAATVLQVDPTAREAARELLADHDRTVEFTARLRADARRESDPAQRAAAWKGVAAVELAQTPERAAQALGAALVSDPSDAEARALLEQLAARPEASGSARDALYGVLRERPSTVLWTLLATLEAQQGDMASAVSAFNHAWRGGAPEALAQVQALSPEADRQTSAVDQALKQLAAVSRDERASAIEALLAVGAHAPGAFRDLAFANRVLGPLVGTDERVAVLWLAITRRIGDDHALAGALRRVATRAAERAVRARAGIELAEMLDGLPETQDDAVDVLKQLLDEQPGMLEAAATLVAMAEHREDASTARFALVAMSHAEHDVFARALLSRLGSEPPDAASPWSALHRAFDDGSRLKDRSDALGVLIDAFGDVPSLLARRTRALLAQMSSGPDGLDAARRLAGAVPLSPEATIAWYGAAGVSGDAEQIADAAVGVVHSLATARDAASVARAAVSRLFTLGERVRGARVAREAAAAIGLADPALRAALVDFAQHQDDLGAAVEIYEAAVAGASDNTTEQLTTLRKVGSAHRQRGDGLGEAYALRRVLVHASVDEEALNRLSALLPGMGDERALARVLSLQLASRTEPVARREAYFTLAAMQARGGDLAAATTTLDRYAEEQSTLEARAEITRALVSIGVPDAAVERLTRWAGQEEDPRVASWLYRAAGRTLIDHGGDPLAVLRLVRAGLSREPEAPSLLLLGEDVATRARAVRPMLDIYADLDGAVAGEHGRQALAYRRAAFLEAVGEPDAALAGYLGVFDKRPVSGALTSAIDRLAEATERHDVRVAMLRRLAESPVTHDARVKYYLDAARIAREQMHDRRTALELSLLAHDVKRDAPTARVVLDHARSLKGMDAQAHREAVHTLIERTLSVADEIWDEALKREMALRALEYADTEVHDPESAVRAVRIYFTGAEDKTAGRLEVTMVLDRIGASRVVREAVGQLADMREPTSAVTPPTGAMTGGRDAIADEALRARLMDLAQKGNAVEALAQARAALRETDDEALRAFAHELAGDVGDAAVELELIDQRLDRLLDNRQRRPLILRSADLLSGPLERPAEARRRIENALAAEPDNDDLIRALHDVVERLGDWHAVAALLETRIAKASDRAEVRALRLHRAAVLEQREDDLAGARAELEAILEDEPAHRAALRYLADLHLREEQFVLAGECFARAAATTPMRAEAAELLATAGDAFARGRDDVAADAQFRRAIELDPRSRRALKGLSDVARRRNDFVGLERSLLAMAENSENANDGVQLKLAAVRAAIEAGVLYRAKALLDAVRRVAPADEVGQLEAILQQARDEERPISRPNLRAVMPATASSEEHGSPVPVTVSPLLDPSVTEAAAADPPAPRDAPREWLAAARQVPRSIDPNETSSVEAPADLAPASSDAREGEAPTTLDSEPEHAIPLVSRTSRKSIPHLVAPAPSSVSAPPTPTQAQVAAEATPVSPDEAHGLTEINDDALRLLVSRGDADAMEVLASRLGKVESGRDEAVRLHRQRFNLHPARLDALDAMAGLYQALNRPSEARAVRSVFDVLSGRQGVVIPPALQGVPEAPGEGGALRMFVPTELLPLAEIGAMLWEALGNVYRRDLVSYGVTGADRVMPTGTTEIARCYAAAVRVLQLSKTGLFVRAEVAGGAQATRTQPPSVILASTLATDTPVTRYMLGAALEATRPSFVLACTLDPHERATLARAANVGFGASGVMAGAAPSTGRLASELIATLTPRAQRRLQELLSDLEAQGTPFTEERWVYTADLARTRAGLLLSGDFSVAASMVIARYQRGEPDMRSALASLDPLRDIARFAVSEPYLLWRWQEGSLFRTWR